MFIHINSWPGAGKKTIGERLARLMDARFLHNHLILDLVEACCNREEVPWQQCYDAVRSAAYQTLARRPRGERLVMTNAIADGETAVWAQIVQLAERRQDQFVPIVLEIGEEENRRRLCDPQRGGSKLKRVDVLDALRADHRLLVPDLPHTLVLEVSAMSAAEAAERIAIHARGIGAGGSGVQGTTPK